MPRYNCKKCDETMHSKNPMIRSVFCDDQVATQMCIISNVVTRKEEVAGELRRTVTIEFPWCDTDPNLSNDELELQCVKNIRGLTDDNVKHWLCDHDWKLVGGEVTVLC